MNPSTVRLARASINQLLSMEYAMKKFSGLIMFLAGAAVILAACSPKPTVPAVDTQPAKQQGVIAEGRLLPASSLDHAFSIPGKVAEVLVNDGELVTKGQVLARLTYSAEMEAMLMRTKQEQLAAQQALDALNDTAELNLARARLDVISATEKFDDAGKVYDANKSEENQANLNLAQAELTLAQNRLEKMENGNGIDPDQLAAAQARLASAEAASASAQAAIDALALTAEIDGTVAGLNLQAGMQIAAGVPVLTVADLAIWIVKTDNLTEMEITGIQTGQKVEVVLDALPDVTLSGEVASIDNRFEEKRGDVTYTVTIRLNQVDPGMRWGMTAAVRFIQ